jgi:uncharacterized protein YprB with RNaseH-like and TPR domain
MVVRTYSFNMKKKQPFIAAWDLETSSLNANGGFIICASIVDVLNGQKVKTFRVDDYAGWKRDPWHDKGVVGDVSRYISDADLWVTYYGKRFDFPFLNTRILYWRGNGIDIPHLANVPHIDLYDTAKRRLKLHSNRLQVVSDLLGNGDKTPLELPVWLRAAGGDKRSIEYVVEHCEKDAIILANNYLDLRPIIRVHPHLSLLSGGEAESCSSCGSDRTQRRGTYATEATVRQRWYCVDCGRWFSTRKAKGT